MPDILSVCLQNFLHSRESVLRTEEIIFNTETVRIFIAQTLLL